MTAQRPPSARRESVRQDHVRTHRSQPKPTRAQTILLDRLAAALTNHKVSLKRTALQSVAAAAFGYRNGHEFAAADLAPPKAAVLGRVSLPQGDLIVVQDPAGAQPYGLPDTLLTGERAETYGISPYGGLLDLSGIASDPTAKTPIVASSAPVTTSASSDQTLHVALIEGWHGTTTYFGLSLDAVRAQVAEYCRAHWQDGPAKRPALTSDQDATIIRDYFDGHEVDDLSFGEIPIAKLPVALPPQTATPSETLTIWVGAHSYDDGMTTYADTTKAGLYRQIADAVREAWGEAGSSADHSDDRQFVQAYFAQHADQESLAVAEHTVQATASVAPTPVQDPDAAWRAQIAKVREDVEAAYPWEGWAQHPVYDTEAWQESVANGDTRLSYWEWLAQTLEEANDEEPYDPSEDDTDYLAALQASSAAVVANVTRQLAPKAAEIDEHPVYRRADWDAERRTGLSLTYAQWVHNAVRDRRDAEEAWLNASLFVNTGIGRRADHVDAEVATTGTEPAKPGFDAILRIACADPRPGKSGIIARPNDLVRVLRWADTPRGVSVWIRVRQDVEIQLNSWERDGLLPISAMPRLPDRVEQHPVYVYRDWLSERGRGARVITYSDWVREREDVDVLKVQNWLRAPCMDALKVAGQRFIIHIHSERGSSENDGAARAQYAPGDSVFIEEAQFTGDIGGLTLSTTDGTTFDLYSEDRNGFFPVSMIPGTGEPLKVVDPTLRHYPQADWLADMKETHRAQSYAEWAQARRTENAFATERWLTLEALRALPGGTDLQIHIHHAATIHDETGRTYDTVCRPGYPVRVAGVDDRTADVSVTFVTEDEGLFALRVADRGGYLPVSIRNPDRSVDFSVWIHRIEQELATTVDPDIYRVYYDQGLSPAEAIAADRAEDGDPGEVTTATTGDDFLWQVAEELGRKDLTHDADFQEFCGNMVGRVTPAQAAESWQRHGYDRA